MSHIAHTVVLFLVLLQLLRQNCTDFVDVVEDMCFFIVVDTGNTCRACQRMSTVGKSAGKCMIVKICCDLLRYHARTWRNKRTGITDDGRCARQRLRYFYDRTVSAPFPCPCGNENIYFPGNFCTIQGNRPAKRLPLCSEFPSGPQLLPRC